MEIDRIWLKHYPEDVPADIQPLQFDSLGEMLDTCYKNYADKIALSFMGREFSYRQIDEYSLNIAAYLQSVGLKKGDHVAIMMPNLPQYTVISTAILRAGFVLVNVNPMYTARELEHQLIDSQAKCIFIIENFAHTLEKVLPSTSIQHVVVTKVGDLVTGVKGWVINGYIKFKGIIPEFDIPHAVSFKRALLRGEFCRPDLVIPHIQPDDVAMLQYTGGTTGVSKGAVLLHSNLLSNVLQTYEWVLPTVKKLMREENQLTFINALPLYHIFAFTINLLVCFYIGGRSVVIVDPRNLSGMLKEMRKQRFHVLPAVNTLFTAILHHPDRHLVDWSSLRLSVAGGMAVQESMLKGWHKLTGCTLVEGYGMSETSPLICATLLERLFDENAVQQSGIGFPVPSTEVILLDDDGNPVPIGQQGELCVRGPQVMAGYWNAPEETAKVMTKDQFLRTGDIAVMDETGWLKIVDRKKDMIIVSGFNVYPNEVENAITLMDEVAECVAIGVPDKKSGEAVAVIVVKKDPALTAEAVKEWCKNSLTGYKRPRYILFKESLPKSAVGKILRREIRPILEDLMKEKA